MTLNHLPSTALTLAALLSMPGILATAQTGSAVSELASRATELERAVANLDGSYSPSSTELLHTLARTYAELGDAPEAAHYYQESLQSLRINEGLASQSQLEILDPYNEVLYRLQDWERLDNNYHLALDISTRLYGRRDPRTQAAARTLASWKIRAFQTNAWRPKGDRSVQEAAEIYRRLLSELPETAEYSALRADYLAARGLAHFFAARHVANTPVEQFQRLAPQTSSYQQCVPLVLSVDGAQPSASACQANQISDPEYFAAQQREKNNTVRRHLGNMRQSFTEAIDAVQNDPNASLEERVRAILNLGDANLLAEDYQRARREYHRAWTLLTEAGALALREELLGRPQRALLDILDELPLDRPLPAAALPGTIAFDVTPLGQIENINVQSPDQALDRATLGAIAIKLDQSVFRPRIEDGRPVRSRLTLHASEL